MTKESSKIESFKIVEFKNSNSNYIKPLRIEFEQDNKLKIWDFIKSHDSVSIILYNKTRDVLIFVKQFRPAIYANRLDGLIDGNKLSFDAGFSLELCAEEVKEEVGYQISVGQLKYVNTYRAGVGINGAKSLMYYCEVTDEMKKFKGGGIDNENIKIIEMTPSEAENIFILSNNVYKDSSEDKESNPTTSSLLFGLLWFLRYRYQKTNC
ncbi:unnamed protein product [Gordionus sp. m RMFG-2023]